MKFMTLFKKELKEMLNTQTILMMVLMFFMLVTMGKGMNKAVEESAEEMMDINICVQDDTDFTNNVVKFLTQSMEKNGGKVNVVELEADDYAAELNRLGIKSLLIIPEGFYESVKNNESADVRFVQKMTSLATLSNVNAGSQVAVEYLTAAVKQMVYSTKTASGKLTQAEVDFINEPLALTESTVINGKTAEISTSVISSLCSMQNMIVPMLMYILINLAANMMITAVSTEKIDKTLETLLSAPVSRLSVILAKMLAAAVIAAMQAVVFLFGMSTMTDGMLESLAGDENNFGEILKDLGLTLGASQYVFVGLQMFLSILIVLAVSLVLGILAKDAKSAQTLTLPIVAVTIIPYLASLLLDINTMSPVLKYLIYAIPFTHSTLASQNMMFGNTQAFVFGAVYQFIFLVLCLAVSLRIFLSDRIFTMSIGGGKKSKTKNAD